MIKLKKNNKNKYWKTTCPYCKTKISFKSLPNVYCVNCNLELPPWQYLLDDSVYGDVNDRRDYHFMIKEWLYP